MVTRHFEYNYLFYESLILMQAESTHLFDDFYFLALGTVLGMNV